MKRLRDLREDRDLRQADISAATGIDQRTLSNYETGKTRPDSESLIRLADFFDVSIDYLVGRTEESIAKNEDVVRELDEIQKRLDHIKKYLK